MKMKKLLSIIICVAVLSTAVSLTTFPASAATYGMLSYKISCNTVTITDCSEYAETIDIPSEIEGYPVTAIGERAFAACHLLTKVTLHKNMTEIGTRAFFDCTALETIDLPDTVVVIGNSAFDNCKSLKTLNIPSSVAKIDEKAFFDCTALTAVTIPASVTEIGDMAFGYYFDYYISPMAKIDGFTIHGTKNTAAEKYAKDNDFKFTDITPALLKGDVNGDGEVDEIDATKILRIASGL